MSLRGIVRGLAALIISALHAGLLAQSSNPDQAAQLQRLYERRALALSLLDRMENGKSPCFTPQCQVQKQKMINALAQNLADIPRVFLKSCDRGLTSAYRFSKRPLLAPEDLNFFPERWEEWVYWWKKRYSAESRLKSEWMLLVAEVRSLRDSIQTYLAWEKFEEPHKNLIREAVDRGLLEIANLSRRSAELRQRLLELSRPTPHRSREERLKRNRQIGEVEVESERVFQKLNDLNQNFQNRTRAVVEELFPEDTFEEVLTTLHILSAWMELFQTEDLFSKSLQAHLKSRGATLQKLSREIQDFNDLEYGVLGLNNFFSTLNPEVSIEQELLIQEFLNEVDSTARMTYTILSFFLVQDSYQTLGNVSARAAYLLTSASNFALNWYDIDTSEWILPRSQRSIELKTELQGARMRMALKQEELFEKIEIVRTQLVKIEAEIVKRGGNIE